MNDKRRSCGFLFFDGTCALCARWAGRVRPLLAARDVTVVAFENGATEPEMRLHWHDGRRFGGADAALFLAGKIWWARPLRLLAALPGLKRVLRWAYGELARRRHCGSGSCAIRHNRRPRAIRGWILATVFVAGAAFIANTWPSWALMWALAFAMWLGFKLMMWLRTEGPRNGKRFAMYLLWPGMDAAAFQSTIGTPFPPTPRPANAVLCAGTGAGLIWGLAPRMPTPVLAGWCGMAGIILVLHLGFFDLLAAAWHRSGVPVRPIMEAPWRARSLADFWSARWNRAFSDLARAEIFRPLVRRFGIAPGTLAGFGFSGLTHELVISVPAGAGYGLPTAYFLLQGLGVLGEKRFAGCLGPTGNRIATGILVLGPAVFLFHPPFAGEVIAPFLTLIGAYPK